MKIDLAKEIEENIIEPREEREVKEAQTYFQILHYYRGYILLNKDLFKWYFILDSSSGVLRVFKSPQDKETSHVFSLQGGTVKPSDTVVWDKKKPLSSFEYELEEEKSSILVIPEVGTSIEELRKVFDFCAKLPPPSKESTGDKIKSGMMEVLRVPWKATNLVICTLEKLSAGAKAAPEKIFHESQQKSVSTAVEEPKHLASGLWRGTGAILESILSALTGIFMEPINGAKKNGFRGAMVGFGKGIVGLVLKPVAGSIDLVTLTARGFANTPTTIYLKLSDIFKRKDSSLRISAPISISTKMFSHVELPEHEGDLNDDPEIIIDRTELRRQLIQGFEKEYKPRITIKL